MTIADLKKAIAQLPDSMPVYVHQDDNNEAWRASEAVMLSELARRPSSHPGLVYNSALRELPLQQPDGLVIG